ncbi:MAG TPA: sigma-70 family RNA polymerase sigma factor [Candidatus Angelobacter sp.]|nr:sigma-70 family RNA polymerase sigma factor [Candidatus Angelobacter sp.]
MTSASGDGVELLAASLGLQAVTDISATAVSEDSQLVEAARTGDRTAFGLLYDRYARMVHGILLARVPFSEVDDLVQDVFLLALPRLGSLRDVARFGPWLAAIARNRATDYHRQRVDQVELTDGLPANESASQMKSSPVEEVEAEFILGLVRTLPETYRETLLLRLVEGMTGPEIAARTGLTPGSVRVNLHRGMQQLREKLAQRSAGTQDRVVKE